MCSIYVSTLSFVLAMPVRKGFKAWLMYGTCVARAVPCISTLRQTLIPSMHFFRKTANSKVVQQILFCCYITDLVELQHEVAAHKDTMDFLEEENKKISAG